MKVILLEDVKKLGKKNDVVEVSNGYANNFLFKKNLAIEASKEKLNELKLKEGAEKADQARRLEDAKNLAEELDGQKFVIKKKSGENGRLYGTLTSIDVAEALKAAGYDIDKRHITLRHDLKNVGSTDVDLKLHNSVSTTITINVEAL